ncbi:hypothetical protein GF323_07035 [Candidatus Woesearchaeota archaeon]|nr:hypothetical protein [Candidatus Woesearchaeota archaeon]
MSLSSRVRDGYRTNRDAGRNRAVSFVRAPFTGAWQSARERWIILIFILAAGIINLFLEVFWPQTLGFYGISLSYFTNTILSTDWIGLYNIFHFNIFFLLLIFIIINMRNNRPHTLRIWLTFILIIYLLSAIPILNTYMGIRNFFELFLLLGTAIYMMRQDLDGEDLVATVTLLWVFYNLYMFGIPLNMGGLIHFSFFVVFFLTFGISRLFEQDRTQVKWWLLFIIIFDVFMPAFFADIYPNLPISTLPFLLFGTLIFAQAFAPSGWSTAGIIVVVAFYFLQFAAASEAFQDMIPQRQAGDSEMEHRKIWHLGYWSSKIAGMMNRSVYHASGQDYYASQVDRNSKKRLGVYLDDISSNSKYYYDNERIIIDATLTAENFVTDEKDPVFEEIGILLGCEACNRDKCIKGEIYPRSEYQIESYEVENIQCIFQPWQMKKGSYDIKFMAEFNFRTEAYLKRYFVSKERIESLRRKQLIKKDEDILKINDISDRNPVAKNSVGPVQIGVSDRIPVVIKLDSQSTNEHLFGIQLVNEWNGEIGKITNMEFYLPEGIELVGGKCDFHMENAPIAEERFEGYERYQLTDRYNPKLYNKIQDRTEQDCWIKIDREDIGNVLQPGDITTRYFRMLTEYEYILEESLPITIREPEGFSVKITAAVNEILDSTSKIKCTAKNDKEFPSDVTFTLYKNGSKESSKSKQCLDNKCEDIFKYSFKAGTNLKCEAGYTEDDEQRLVAAYTTVENSPAKIKNIEFEKEKVNKGENLVCSVETADKDNDHVTVRFEFEGLYIASSQKACNNKCKVEIPTGSAEKETVVTCIATAYDTQKGEQGSAKAKIIVQNDQ